MRDRQPIRTARRKVRQQEREKLGLAVSPCIFCIEEHHVAGRNHDPRFTEPICQKHHREIGELLLRAGVSMGFEPNTAKRITLALRATATYDRKRADAMERWADLLDQSHEGNQ
jgi:hypothetical protein